MSEEDRETSISKNVHLESYAQNALDREPSISGNFNEQSLGKGRNGRSDQSQSQGSSMVEEDGSRLENRPPPEIASAQDRQSFDERWEAERSRAADDHQDRFKDLEDFEKHQAENGLDNDRSDDLDYGR